MTSYKRDILESLIEIKSMPILLESIGDKVSKKSIVIDAMEDFELLSERFDGERLDRSFCHIPIVAG